MKATAINREIGPTTAKEAGISKVVIQANIDQDRPRFITRSISDSDLVSQMMPKMPTATTARTITICLNT